MYWILCSIICMSEWCLVFGSWWYQTHTQTRDQTFPKWNQPHTIMNLFNAGSLSKDRKWKVKTIYLLIAGIGEGKTLIHRPVAIAKVSWWISKSNGMFSHRSEDHENLMKSQLCDVYRIMHTCLAKFKNSASVFLLQPTSGDYHL